MPHKKTEYDLIFSIGEACSCTSALRAAYLQIASYPFDWLFGSDFIGRCKILSSEFARFIEKDDLEYVFSARSISCDAYHNVYNGLTFNHDFLMNKKLDETYSDVKAKYARRIQRLLDNIKNAKRILIVYIETPETGHIEVNDSTILEGYNIIKNKFKDKNIDLLYFCNSGKLHKIEKLSQNLVKATIYYKSKNNDAEDYDVDQKVLKDFLTGYCSLKLPFGKVFFRTIKKMLINLMPSSKLRKKLRKKYHL